MAGRSGLEPGLSKERPGRSLVPQFPAGVLDLPIASITILQTSSFPLRVTAAQGTQHGPSPTPAVPVLPLLGGCCCLAGTTTPGHPPHSNELLCDAEIHFRDSFSRSITSPWLVCPALSSKTPQAPKSPTFCLINHSSITAKYDPLAWLLALLPLCRREGAA